MSKVYCEIDINSKESYSGMSSNGTETLKAKYSKDITSLNDVIQCAGNGSDSSNNSNTNIKWQMGLEDPTIKK